MSKIRVLHHGEFAEGGNDFQRHRSLCARKDIACIQHNFYYSPAERRPDGLYARIRWRLREPVDLHHQNARLIAAAEQVRPDVVLVENSKVIRRATLRALRRISNPVLAFLSSDDIMAKHNLSRPIERCLQEWDIVFTTKSFNVAELRAAGVANPVLLTNAFDPTDHRPMTIEEVGEEFEAFDAVFIGTFEQNRARSLYELAEAGLSVLVHGSAAGKLRGAWADIQHPAIVHRPAVVGPAYSQALHKGKIALGFLRKINRDQITTRSMEIPAAQRCMLAEKTDEHDAHFVDGKEYVGFTGDEEMIAKAKQILQDNAVRRAIAAAGYDRCFRSGYDIEGQIERILTECRRMSGQQHCITRARHQ